MPARPKSATELLPSDPSQNSPSEPETTIPQVGIKKITRIKEGLQVELTDGSTTVVTHETWIHHPNQKPVLFLNEKQYPDMRTEAEAKSHRARELKHATKVEAEQRAANPQPEQETLPETLPTPKSPAKVKRELSTEDVPNTLLAIKPTKKQAAASATKVTQTVSAGKRKTQVPPKRGRSTKMSETATIPMKAAKKKAVKKVAVKKKAAKGKSSSPANVEYGAEKSHDLPWTQKKVDIFRAMKQMKAVGKDNARSAADIAEKAGVNTKDVRHYCYHAAVSGYTLYIENVEGIRGYAFCLTAKGAALDPTKELKQQEAAKAAK